MKTNDPIYIGDDAVSELLAYCDTNNLSKFVLVSDTNTYAALGQRVEAAIKEKNYDLTTIVLDGEEVIADARYLTHVLVHAPVEQQTFIAVGSGTITDITRFISYRTHNKFISMPTATSVDGFTSIGAPLVLDGVKQTLISQPPLAVFADVPTLQDAPQRLIASGFGDMVGKITSLADWKLGQLLWEEPYDEAIAARSRKGLDTCLSYADEIGTASAEGIRYLADGLMESGLCMVEFGSSRPASGAEHHLSHYWEMMLLQEERPPILHGAKVGFATTIIVDLYSRLGAMDQNEWRTMVENATLPDPDAELKIIRDAYGDVAEDVIQSHQEFLGMSQDEFDQLKQRLLNCWEDIKDIAANVPSSEEVAEMLNKVHGPTTPEALGLTQDEVNRGLQYGHFLRSRFTVRKLFHLLGMDVAYP